MFIGHLSFPFMELTFHLFLLDGSHIFLYILLFTYPDDIYLSVIYIANMFSKLGYIRKLIFRLITL